MAKITLEPIEQGHLKLLQTWRNSETVLPYCRQYRKLSHRDMEEWYDKLHKDKDYNLANDLFLIHHKCRGVIGVGGFVRIDWRNRKAELSFYVAETTIADYEEVVTSALSVLMGYAFKTLGMHKIYWPVYSFNSNLPIYEKVLQREYVAKKEYFWEGQFHDRIILVAYEKEFVRNHS